MFAVLSRCSSRTPAASRPPSDRDLVHPGHRHRAGPLLLFVVWALLMIAGTSNGVNLTDGLDGLATGASVMVFGAVHR